VCLRYACNVEYSEIVSSFYLVLLDCMHEFFEKKSVSRLTNNAIEIFISTWTDSSVDEYFGPEWGVIMSEFYHRLLTWWKDSLTRSLSSIFSFNDSRFLL
jgi:hypothetical protein